MDFKVHGGLSKQGSIRTYIYVSEILVPLNFSILFSSITLPKIKRARGRVHLKEGRLMQATI